MPDAEDAAALFVPFSTGGADTVHPRQQWLRDDDDAEEEEDGLVTHSSSSGVATAAESKDEFDRQRPVCIGVCLASVLFLILFFFYASHAVLHALEKGWTWNTQPHTRGLPPPPFLPAAN